MPPISGWTPGRRPMALHQHHPAGASSTSSSRRFINTVQQTLQHQQTDTDDNLDDELAIEPIGGGVPS
ncbi:hypothetical protein TRIATDRAFT_310250 [Trichoderma atroviride IMI 206040]|uniref:Uncharacterized protein n=1 Tax=Hypocrea atroviridis (strain ATCC 20476 / IMI 206040) TaxID=452589 RepID=G9P2C5_HYPAI|nr:uncharacterized protein TRIATDRAFT_310250 [Trichoderma atroviride IMI 206040]EHK42664.1 hypothetical protein TRIATDRAFT_310250 [Trichoderma atroviride IMI 206040]